MSRSVSTHRNAYETVYLHGLTFGENDFFDEDEDGEEEDEGFVCDYYEFGDFIDDLREVVRERYPSFSDVDKWVDREDHVILENGAAGVSVAEYNGLISVCLFPHDDDYAERNAGYANWTRRVADRFGEHVSKRFASAACRKIGTASNGEAFFAPVNRPEGVVTSKEGVLW